MSASRDTVKTAGLVDGHPPPPDTTGMPRSDRCVNLRVDVLEIDLPFVSRVDTDPYDRAVIIGTRQVAGALGITTVAEGVERIEQVHALAELGCRAFQVSCRHAPSRSTIC